MSHNQYIIFTGGNKTLNAIVNDLALKAGYINVNPKMAIEEARAFRLEESGRIKYSSNAGVPYEGNYLGVPRLDACARFIDVVQALDHHVTIEGVAGHKAIIAPDKESVQVGCQTITRAKVREVWAAMQ